MFDPLAILWQLLGAWWWLIIFWPLWRMTEDTWLFWRQEVYKANIPWAMLEMRIPREIRKSPRAMEQALMAIHQLRNAPGDLKEWYRDGEVTHWLALEMVSFGGEIHFYLRVDGKKRGLIEAAIFSYYPDVELVEVDDYVDRFPENIVEMYRQGYDMWGSEMVLKKEAGYPIKSYLDFESPDEDKQYDPISVFMEVLGKVKAEEMVGIQMLLTPAADDWSEHFTHIVDKLAESKKSPGHGGHGGGLTTNIHFPGGILPSFEPVKHEKKEEYRPFMMRTPGQTDVLTAVEKNLSKPAFETLIRFVYFSPKAIFYDSFARRGIVGAFNQYGSADLNSFAQNYAVSTRTQIWNWPHIFPEIRNEYKKQRLIYNYKRRKNPMKTFMAKLISSTFFNHNFSSKKSYLSAESIATLYHPPTFIVLTAPHVKRVDSRKAGPPAGLAIFGNEEEIEKFQ